MSPSREQPDPREPDSGSPDHELMLWLDGELPADRVRAMKDRLRSDDMTTEAIHRLAAAERDLARVFAPPAEVPPLPEAPRTLAFMQRPAPALLSLAAAAMVALSLWFLLPLVRPAPLLAPTASFAQVYAALTPRFSPDHICTTPESFTQYAVDYLSIPLALTDYPASLELVGWSPAILSGGRPVLSRQAVVLFARYESDPLLVVVDLAANDSPAARDAAQQLTAALPQDARPNNLNASILNASINIFRTEAAGVVAYELTTRDQPVITPRLTLDSSSTLPPG